MEVLVTPKQFNIILEAKKAFFKRIKLPYKYNALKDFVGEETMWEHYNKHYKGYTTKLNEALSKRKIAPKHIETLIKSIKNYDKFTRDNAGGYYNHSLFWTYLTPKDTKPSEKLLNKINSQFGSLANFKRQFDEGSQKVFGSGWCWLVKKNSTLKIITTPNQDNPLMDNKGFPLLGLDVWEHAYYLNYMADRKKYIKDFWKVVNWDTVSDTYEDLS